MVYKEFFRSEETLRDNGYTYYVYPPSWTTSLSGITVTTVIWLEGLDGGEAFGADGLQSKQGQGDVGSGLELERSLEQVAARGWLNEQSQLPVEDGGSGHRPADLGGIQPSQGKETTNLSRALLVIDARSERGSPQHASP